MLAKDKVHEGHNGGDNLLSDYDDNEEYCGVCGTLYEEETDEWRNGLLVMTAELGIIGNIQTLWWNQSFIYVLIVNNGVIIMFVFEEPQVIRRGICGRKEGD